DKYICAYFVSDQEYSLTELHEFMSKQLPDYMIPSYFIHLEKIPLTPNGKIDRKALPKPGLKAAQDYAAPRNKIETQLVSLWSELLNIKPDIISIDANFFRLGGHSLKATVLLVKIQKEFNVNIPLGTIFYAPTIRLLAEYINCEEKIQVPIDDDLILLKKSPGSRNNLFFIHDGSGEVEGYLEFCSCLGTDFPFNCLGIRAKWWNNEAPQDVTIEEIAGRYIKKIKTIQPTGPFYVMGWSFGGTIAFEITRQLETLNEKVKFLAMIDVVAPFNKMGQRPNTPCTDPEKELDFIRNLPGGETFLKELPGITGIENTWPAFVRFLETQPGEAQRIKALAAQSEGLIIPNLDFLNIGEVIRFFNMTRSFIKARAFYMPAAKIAAPVHYFRPTQSQVKNAKQWNHFAHNKMSIYDVAGDHYSIFKPPHAADFAAAFNKVLKRIKEDDR
ncbi:MAG: thioesterase domain-containing protein, partial [Acidobacteria bacterium]|nr:thioesterase domain-containing protein [Acidobacteriota bacterium]